MIKAQRLTTRGQTHTVREWSAISGVPRRVIAVRITRGWATEDAIFTPAFSHGGPRKPYSRWPKIDVAEYETYSLNVR
jgi:hypothetical protein